MISCQIPSPRLQPLPNGLCLQEDKSVRTSCLKSANRCSSGCKEQVLKLRPDLFPGSDPLKALTQRVNRIATVSQTGWVKRELVVHLGCVVDAAHRGFACKACIVDIQNLKTQLQSPEENKHPKNLEENKYPRIYQFTSLFIVLVAATILYCLIKE